MELSSWTIIKFSRITYLIILINFTHSSLAGSCLNNNTNISDNHDCFRMDIHLKHIHWLNETVTNKNLSLLGRINENITVGIFINASNRNEHMMTFYGTYVKDRRDSSLLSIYDNNIEIEEICNRLISLMLPNQIFKSSEHFPASFLKFIINEIQTLDYKFDTGNDTDEIKTEFIHNFYFDNWITEDWCIVLTHNQTEERNNDIKYLICLSPYLTTEQINILYNDYYREVAYINYTSIASIVSDVFKCLTLFVYIILPSLRRNIYGKCIMLYLISAIISYGGFSLINLQNGNLGFICQPLGFLVQFTWLTNFTLQSVMCLEILLTVRFMRNPWRSVNTTIKMVWYCLYAYGFPGAVTLVTILLQFSPILSDDNPWKPNLGGDYCFFPNNTPDKRVRWLYFYGIYSALIVINFCMFMATAVKIKSYITTNSYKDGDSKEKTRKQDRNMFGIHIKLFFVMGCNWIFDVIIVIKNKTSIPDEADWFLRIADSLNFMIGIILFIVLVCNLSTLRKLKARFIQIFESCKHRDASAPKQTDNCSIDESIINDICLSKV